MKTAAVIALCVLGSSCGAEESANVEQVEVQILGRDGEVRLAVLADVARTAAARSTGLEGRQGLPDDEALLLLFPSETEACIRNSTVSFPIDAVFLSGAGEVVAVERALPAGDGEVVCQAQTAAVLEVAASVADAVVIGDHSVAH